MFKRHPFYLPTNNGHLFCLHYIPDSPIISNTLFFPPFAEELNRSRHLISLMAAQLAENGHAVLIVDLFGTGDSEGDFSDARWAIWKYNMLQAIGFLQQQNALPVNFLSIRLGTLLALDILGEQLQDSPPLLINNLIAWQPVFNTTKLLQQFLRLQLAGKLIKENQYKTTRDIEQHIRHMGTVEIAGYPLSIELMDDILSLSDLKKQRNILHTCQRFSFFQITSASVTSFSKDIQSFLLKYPKIQEKINVQLIQAKPFWQIYDTKDIPKLRNLTLAKLSDAVDSK